MKEWNCEVAVVGRVHSLYIFEHSTFQGHSNSLGNYFFAKNGVYEKYDIHHCSVTAVPRNYRQTSVSVDILEDMHVKSM